jgi:regulator of PEP synthase PpsR (kinase-PPPase family)
MMERSAVPVFFLSDSTGISAETLGNALLIQFADLAFERHLIRFITTAQEARRVVAVLDAALEGPVTSLAFQLRPQNCRYASPEQCAYELRQAEAMFRGHRIPMINSSTRSVEEISTVILQTLNKH